jgi:hypothetical protein
MGMKPSRRFRKERETIETILQEQVLISIESRRTTLLIHYMLAFLLFSMLRMNEYIIF